MAQLQLVPERACNVAHFEIPQDNLMDVCRSGNVIYINDDDDEDGDDDVDDDDDNGKNHYFRSDKIFEFHILKHPVLRS